MSPPSIRRVCVYCASSLPEDRRIVDACEALGRALVDRGLELVYGGGAVGLMGLIADTVLAEGGRATGILPTVLFPKEVAHDGLTELVEVGSMHERKAEMIRRSDAFCALPGGVGTLEELAEVLTWAQIGLHAKPTGLLNVAGYYDHLLAFFDRGIADGLLRPATREFLLDHHDPGALLDALCAFRPTGAQRVFDLDQV